MSATPRRTFRLTPRGWGLLVVAVILLLFATFTNRREGLFVAVFLILVLALCVASVILQRIPLEVSRRVPPELPCIDDVEVVCELRFGGNLAAVTGWSDETPSEWGVSPSGVMPPAKVQRGGRLGIRYRVRAPQRGRWHIGPFRVTLEDPLGVCASSRAIGESTPVIVRPRIVELTDVAGVSAPGEGRLHDRIRPAAPRADELIAREYRPGDPLRRVHWRATARRGELMVRQEEPQGDPEALLVIDIRPGSSAVDSLIEMAASAAVHLIDRGYRVTTAEQDAGILAIGAENVAAFLSHLATAEGTPVAEPHALVRQLEQRMPRGVPTILVSDSLDRLTALAALGAHGDPALAFVATESPRVRDDAPRPWVVTGLTGRFDVGPSWERMHRSITEHSDVSG
ncbi:DUF58 domain-containing protein [Paramicrobacterium sp. CJ85]|uniref:DUF58 domain-containing protein n=1 Tax=Paramicrobacterium sp. CJ85 TaxID=3445355 RepID=UPI003F5FF32D